jgi:type II secretion system (T2SS) protein E
MNLKSRDTLAHSLADPHASTAEQCHCQPLSSLQAVPTVKEEHASVEIEKTTPATAQLNAAVRARLADFFPRSTPFGLFLLHVSQVEQLSLTQQASINSRQRYHASASFLAQVLANVRRAIRDADQILIDEGAGAAIIFPEVDLQGVSKILERIYRSVSLLHSETVIPPLDQETDVVMGIGAHPESGGSLEHLLHHVSTTARRFTLRPAITTQLWSIEPQRGDAEELAAAPISGMQQAGRPEHVQAGIPFMQLPSQLPARLKSLIPYSIALKLCCAPVGRDRHRLTVAMAEPSDGASIRYLAEITGLAIFPVSCDIALLQVLLANKW